MAKIGELEFLGVEGGEHSVGTETSKLRGLFRSRNPYKREKKSLNQEARSI